MTAEVLDEAVARRSGPPGTVIAAGVVLLADSVAGIVIAGLGTLAASVSLMAMSDGRPDVQAALAYAVWVPAMTGVLQALLCLIAGVLVLAVPRPWTRIAGIAVAGLVVLAQAGGTALVRSSVDLPPSIYAMVVTSVLVNAAALAALLQPRTGRTGRA